MEYGLNDIVEMKKQHPCGTNRWQITRMGADIKIKCLKCDNNIMMPRREFNKKIKKVALINGSAMSYWRKAKKEKIDLFITGDVGYHDALDARESGLAVIDFGHYESEHFFHEVLIKELKEINLEFLVYNPEPVFKFY